MEENNKKVWIVGVIIVVVVLLFLGYVYGIKKGDMSNLFNYKQGYRRGQSDLHSAQGEAAQKAVEAAAEEANPFEVDPYESVKDALNPFK